MGDDVPQDMDVDSGSDSPFDWNPNGTLERLGQLVKQTKEKLKTAHQMQQYLQQMVKLKADLDSKMETWTKDLTENENWLLTLEQNRAKFQTFQQCFKLMPYSTKGKNTNSTSAPSEVSASALNVEVQPSCSNQISKNWDSQLETVMFKAVAPGTPCSVKPLICNMTFDDESGMVYFTTEEGLYSALIPNPCELDPGTKELAYNKLSSETIAGSFALFGLMKLKDTSSVYILAINDQWDLYYYGLSQADPSKFENLKKDSMYQICEIGGTNNGVQLKRGHVFSKQVTWKGRIRGFIVVCNEGLLTILHSGDITFVQNIIFVQDETNLETIFVDWTHLGHKDDRLIFWQGGKLTIATAFGTTYFNGGLYFTAKRFQIDFSSEDWGSTPLLKTLDMVSVFVYGVSFPRCTKYIWWWGINTPSSMLHCNLAFPAMILEETDHCLRFAIRLSEEEEEHPNDSWIEVQNAPFTEYSLKMKMNGTNNPEIELSTSGKTSNILGTRRFLQVCHPATAFRHTLLQFLFSDSGKLSCTVPKVFS